MSGDEFPSRYEPAPVEQRWLARWEEEQAFRPESGDPAGRPFVVVIPPPNVTGRLHMGHALNNTLQDVMVRYHRLRGRRALWVPGTDHAGIATQNVVEKALAREGKTRQELGREAFLERVWRWKEEYGGAILDQLARLGCSCDWSRTRFTMDPGMSRAVTECFVRLFDAGLVFRGERLINWCPRCETALSDEEAEVAEEEGSFWHLRYPLVGDEGRFLVVATTRPETMLGDAAVAVHPDDARFQGLVGRFVRLPLLGRPIPVIADPYADPSKGSGAVKITPAHDFNDFAVGERHGLPRHRIFDERAVLTAEAGPYAGLPREEARRRVVADLEAQGLVHKVETRFIPLPRCYRCQTVVEPHLSRQWFVRMRPLLEPAAEAVRSGRLRIRPERFARTYLDWVEQYRDWCISRQVWWGHRIPVWYDEDGEPAASVEPLAAGHPHPRTGKPVVAQDQDVLDTWFSSQLWPFSVFGWPEETADLADYYPTDLLVTAREIIYFWVARMVMCGLHFRGRLPFHTVYITGTVLDELGRRMSKSLGNGIDPLEMGGLHGMDAVRWTLVSLSTEGQDIKLARSRFEGGRNFVNKLWNAARFVARTAGSGPAAVPASHLAVEDRWILSGLRRLISGVEASLEDLRFHECAQMLYEFTWSSFCDWYLELAKDRLRPEAAPAERAAASGVLRVVTTRLLRLLHPVIPFVTEEIAARLEPGRKGCLARAEWPELSDLAEDPAAERLMGRLIALVRAVRTARDRGSAGRGIVREVRADSADPLIRADLQEVAERARALAKAEAVVVSAPGEKPPGSFTVVEAGFTIHVGLEGGGDREAERQRLLKERATIEAGLGSLRAKLSNPAFLSRAPATVVEGERRREEELNRRLDRIDLGLRELG
jgi:valyl-tRNA synthetase